MKNNSVDLGAKLLASENITVVRDRVSTASFDIKSRVLTLPQWKDMSTVVEEMLIAHEVGHALYTSHDYIKPLLETPYLKGYLNIIEDARVEKLVKRKYPGVRKIMTDAYKELNEKDFFGLKKLQSLSELKFIDRINVYFKIGVDSGVAFNETEREYVFRIERAETIAEVIALTQEIYAYCYESASDEASEFADSEDGYLNYADSEDDAFSAIEVDDADLLEGMSSSQTLSKEADVDQDENIHTEIQPTTEDAFSEKLVETADLETMYCYYELDETLIYDPIIPYKQVLTETKLVDEKHSTATDEHYAKFKVESNRVVSYLVKEFEMRKSAQAYKRSQISKVGSLDMKKIWSYKINEDLFKRVVNTPNGKNHGMVFLLDWSGSMNGVLKQTLEQVINLALFCHRSQIPYQVFAFTSGYKYTSDETVARINDYLTSLKHVEEKSTKVLSNNFGTMHLLEFLSSKMTNVEFNTMSRRLLNLLAFNRIPGYNTVSTPLNEALSHMVLHHIPRFINSFNVEKMSFITLTDGQGGALTPCNNDHLRPYAFKNYTRVHVRNFLVDPVTKKTYPLTDSASQQTKVILSMIKDRYVLNSVGFYICPNKLSSLREAIKDNVPESRKRSDAIIESLRQGFKKDGFGSLANSGRDDLFIVPHDKIGVEDDEFDVDSEQTSRQIARNFSKAMTGRRTSRVLLNNFIKYVA